MKLKFVGLIIMLFSLSTPALAGGGGSYPNGAEGFLVGAAPPPGLYGVSYTSYFHIPELIDDSGDDVPVFDRGDVFAQVFRLIWISKYRVLNGNYGQHIFFPFLYQDLSFKSKLGPEQDDSYNDFNMPYVIWSPFLLTYHLLNGKLHMVVSLVDMYIPLNNEDRKNLSNVGHNFWTFEPAFGITYFLDKLSFSAKFMYDFNTKQKNFPTVYGLEVDRDPGQEFHFDYNVSYGLSQKLRIGLGGFYYTQVTDDDYDMDGVPAQVKTLLKKDETDHSKAFAIGPGIWLQLKKNLFVTLRYQQTVYERNFGEMKNIWLKVIYGF